MIMINLAERFATVEDVTDPEAFTEILMYAEQLKAEDEEFMQILLERKQEMCVTWAQPWYQQSNSLTRTIKGSSKMEIESFRTDHMTKEESDKIHKNWRKLRKLLNLPNKPICLARWRNTNKSKNPKTPEECVRRFVIAFLAQGLERSLHQVYKHFVARYGNHAKGFYTPFEENIMEICLYHTPKNAVPLASFVLGREPRHIYKRIQQKYKEPTQFKKIKWTLPVATKFLNLLIQYTGKPLKKLRNKRFDKSVWMKLQDDMGQNYVYLQYHWYSLLHVQLFAKCDVKRNELRKMVFKKLKNYPYKVWSDIRWKEILNNFRRGFTHIFIYNVCYSVVRKKLDYFKMPLEDLITFALEAIKKFPSKRLKTLCFNDKQELEEIRYDNKNYEK